MHKHERNFQQIQSNDKEIYVGNIKKKVTVLITDLDSGRHLPFPVTTVRIHINTEYIYEHPVQQRRLKF